MKIKLFLKNLIYRMRGTYTVEQLVKMGLTVGENFNPQLGTTLDPSHCWLITIGDDVTMAPNVQVLAHDASTFKGLGYTRIGRVEIGNRVFVGAGTIILPNVVIGNDVVIGAGSVVTHSIESGMVCAGNPARVICTREEFINKHKEKMKQLPVYDESYTLRGDITEEKKKEQKEALNNHGGYVI